MDKKVFCKNAEVLMEECMGNELIWQHISSYLATDFLLSSCSLVSQTWNTRVRKYVRDYRRCTVKHPEEEWQYISPCKFLQEFNQLCGRLTAGGRIIPWNAMKITFDYAANDIYCSDHLNHKIPLENLMVSSFKLKHLRIYWPFEEKSSCIIHKPFTALLSHKSQGIQTLAIDSFRPKCNGIMSQWQPDFPSLVQIEFPSLHLEECQYSQTRDDVKRLLEVTPQLRRILPGNQFVLGIIPEDKYKLLQKLQLAYVKPEDEIMWKNIIEAKPIVTELLLMNMDSTSARDADNTSMFVARLRQSQERCLWVMEQLFQTCCNSMKHLEIDGLHSLNQVSFPPLLNLSKIVLKMDNWNGEFERFWGSIATIDYDRHMPNLEEMEIVMQMRAQSPRRYKIECRGMKEWPPSEKTGHWCVSSVRKLTLELQVKAINVPLLKIVFPHVTRLELRVNDNRVSRAELAPFTAIWEAWPELTELLVTGKRNNDLKRSYDADFLGIFQEEVKLLMEKDEEYLQAVHIVPIKPSIMNMKNLRKLLIDVEFCGRYWDGPTHVISQVTKSIAFKRMARTEIFVAVPQFRFTSCCYENEYWSDDDSDEDGRQDLHNDEPDNVSGNEYDPEFYDPDDFMVNYGNDVE